MRAYVGTYAKYSSGSLKGKWFDLEDYADYDDFLSACRECHSDELDPEFMIQDTEEVPSFLGVCAELWDVLALDDYEREPVIAYLDSIGTDSIGSILDNFLGSADSILKYAEDNFHQRYDVPQEIAYYIDYEAYARDTMCNCSVAEYNGKVYVFGY